jgi:nucleoside 2-deoxyribosyltransferase
MDKKRIFVIGPVRAATLEERLTMQWHVECLESWGNIVHLPHRDTNQKETGLNICRENLDAIRKADEVHVFFTPGSSGTHFDLGMAFALGKKIKVIETVEYTPGKSFANMIEEWEEWQDASGPSLPSTN